MRIYDAFRHPDLLDQLAESAVDQVAERWRRWWQFADDEAPFILERLAAVGKYQEQLAARVRRLQQAEDQKALDKAGSGPDLLLTVIAGR